MDIVKLLAKNLKFLRERTGLNQAKMSTRIGFHKTTWNNYEREVSKPGLDDLSKIIRHFKITYSQILETDLSKGEYSKETESDIFKPKSEHLGDYRGDFSAKNRRKGEILSTVNEDQPEYKNLNRIPQVITVDTQGNENVIMVPVKARAGYLNGYADPEFMQSLPAYRLPGLNNGSFRLFEVEGVSMYPTLSSSDLVIGQNVEQLQLIRDDRVHVVVTKNEGIVVKRVLNRIKQDGKLILKSDNYKDRDLYPTIVCTPGDILEVWYAIGFISRQLRPPAEMYNRLIDLEGRFTLLEAKLKKK